MPGPLLSSDASDNCLEPGVQKIDVVNEEKESNDIFQIVRQLIIKNTFMEGTYLVF